MAKAQKAGIEAAVELFNRKPSVKSLAGVGGLSAVDPEPTAVAEFLRDAKGLDKTAIGELLGSHEADALAVMHAFVDGFQFATMDFDVALRSFLQPFRLPGEAQKIDRLMEAFAARYCHCNPGVFSNPDAAYVLAFAVIPKP
jgi:Sec7-like guanine-nucleotide exchange factor